MLFNTVLNIGTSTSMIHNICTGILCLLLLLLVFMINNTLSSIVDINAHNSIFIHSTTIIILMRQFPLVLLILVLIVVGLLFLLLLLLLLSLLPLFP